MPTQLVEVFLHLLLNWAAKSRFFPICLVSTGVYTVTLQIPNTQFTNSENVFHLASFMTTFNLTINFLFYYFEKSNLVKKISCMQNNFLAFFKDSNYFI